MNGKTLSMLVVFGLLMTIKLLLLLGAPFSNELSGDEFDYVPKAHYLYKHHEFRKIVNDGQSHQTLLYSDFRPPGYPLFLAPFFAFVDEIADLRFAVSICHFVLDALTTFLILTVVFRLFESAVCRWTGVLVLGLQPWTSSYIVSMYPDTLTMFLVLFGVALIALFVVAKSKIAVVFALLGGSTLLSLSFLVRPEMILFSFLTIGLGIALGLVRYGMMQSLFYGALAALPFLLVVAANVSYRLNVAQEFRIFGEFRHATPGLWLWSKTWVGNQRDKEMVVWGPLFIGVEGFAKLPRRAFSNEGEQKLLFDIVAAVAKRGSITPAEDRLFGKVAEARIAQDPFTYYVGNRLFASANFWLNLENASHYLNGFAKLPHWASKLLTASFFALKCVILLFCVIGISLLPYRRLHALYNNWAMCFLVIGLFFVLSRTFYFGFFLGWVEYRYALPAWPFVLALAFYGLGRLWQVTKSDG